MPLTKAEARRLALSIEGAEERPYFGKPAIFVQDQFLARVHDKENAVVIITNGIEMRDMMLEAEPALFYITDHYRKWPTVLARLDRLDRKTLRELLGVRLSRIGEKATKTRKSRKTAKKAAKRVTKTETAKKKKAAR